MTTRDPGSEACANGRHENCARICNCDCHGKPAPRATVPASAEQEPMFGPGSGWHADPPRGLSERDRKAMVGGDPRMHVDEPKQLRKGWLPRPSGLKAPPPSQLVQAGSEGDWQYDTELRRVFRAGQPEYIDCEPSSAWQAMAILNALRIQFRVMSDALKEERDEHATTRFAGQVTVVRAQDLEEELADVEERLARMNVLRGDAEAENRRIVADYGGNVSLNLALDAAERENARIKAVLAVYGYYVEGDVLMVLPHPQADTTEVNSGT